MSYYYGQPAPGHSNPSPNQPYPPQLAYPQYPVAPQASVSHSPVDPQGYYGTYVANPQPQAMPNYGQTPRPYPAYNPPQLVSNSPPTDPNKRPLPNPAFRSRPASVVIPPTYGLPPQGAPSHMMHMQNMSASIPSSSFSQGSQATPSRPTSIHGTPSWSSFPTQMPSVSPVSPSSRVPPVAGRPPPTANPLPTPGMVHSDPNKRPLPPPPPGGAFNSSQKGLPVSPSLPAPPSHSSPPGSALGANTQTLPPIPSTGSIAPTTASHISTTVANSATDASTSNPIKPSSPTKRSLPVAPGGGGIVPGAPIPDPVNRSLPPTDPTKSSSLPSLTPLTDSNQSASSTQPPSRSSPSSQPPAQFSTTPLPDNSSPPPTSAPSSYASARSVFSKGSTASPPPTGRPMSSTSDTGGDDKIPLWKKMAIARGDLRPSSVYGHRAKGSADEGASAAPVIVAPSTPNKGIQLEDGPSNVSPATSSQPEPQVPKDRSPVPPVPSPSSKRPPLPNPPGSTASIPSAMKRAEHVVHVRSASAPAKDHPPPAPPKLPDSKSRLSKASAQTVTPATMPRAKTTSPPRVVAASPPRASAMKSGTRTHNSRSEIISTSPPRVQVPPPTRSSPLPPSPTRPSHSRQATAPASSYASSTASRNEPAKVSMALRFAAGDVGKHANNNKDWAKWALASTKEVVEKPVPLEGYVERKNSGRRRSASTGQIEDDGPPSTSRRGSFDAGTHDRVVLSNSTYPATRSGGARPMPSTSRPHSQASSHHSRGEHGGVPQYRPSYSDSEPEGEETSNPRITVSGPAPQINVTQVAPQIEVIPVGGSSRSRSESNPPPPIPNITVGDGDDGIPAIAITVDEPSSKDAVVGVPVFSFSGPDNSEEPSDNEKGKKKKKHKHRREKSVKEEEDERERARQEAKSRPLPPKIKKRSARCGKCDKSILGRIVSAMDARWHPECFKCTACNMLLEHVSSYEHDDRPYCHLDYHELFAPRCFHCKTPIMEEHFITLDDDALGKRTYHEQHFFCAECGDPFLAPKQERKTRMLPNGMLEVVDQDDEVGFTVYKGHPYCEACHVRLRMPKCKRCKKSIRPGDQAIEALGGKWCWDCFTCERCGKPFDDPQFYESDKRPYCQPCYSILLRNQLG